MLNFSINVNNIEFFDKGKRAWIYTGVYKRKKVGIKIKNPSSKAVSRIENEGYFLKKLNKYEIGPKLIVADKEYIIYEFIEGEQYYNLLPNISRKERINLSLQILDKCRIMDKLKINKLEFTRPIKHFFVKSKKVKIIDFERCYITKKPKNVTQFCNFLISNKKLFGLKREKLTPIMKTYKKKQTEKNYKKIKELIKSPKN
jgi:predicted Ser/Thr protein kinase